MSNHLALILPNTLSDEQIDIMRKEYKFDLFRVYNNSLKKFLNKDENFFVVHMYGEDTGITRYDQYVSHFTDIEELINVWGFDMYYDNITDINERWLNDANNWVNIIKDIKYKYHIDKIGLIDFYANDVYENIIFEKKTREEISIAEMNAVTLMKLNTEVIYIFT